MANIKSIVEIGIDGTRWEQGLRKIKSGAEKTMRSLPRLGGPGGVGGFVGGQLEGARGAAREAANFAKIGGVELEEVERQERETNTEGLTRSALHDIKNLRMQALEGDTTLSRLAGGYVDPTASEREILGQLHSRYASLPDTRSGDLLRSQIERAVGSFQNQQFAAPGYWQNMEAAMQSITDNQRRAFQVRLGAAQEWESIKAGTGRITQSAIGELSVPFSAATPPHSTMSRQQVERAVQEQTREAQMLREELKGLRQDFNRQFDF